jgi:hypothetical protein
MTPERQKALEIFDKYNQIAMFNLYLIVDAKTKLEKKEIKNYVKSQAVIGVQQMIDEYNTQDVAIVADRLIFLNNVKNEIGRL